MLEFITDEKKRIEALLDTEESFRQWYAHYLTLTPEQQAVVDYLLTAAGKDSYADAYMGLQLCPVSCADQKNVNNGYGILYAIRRECFPQKDVKFIFLRSDMCISSKVDPTQIPQWIKTMEDEIRRYSSGLTDIQTETIPHPFGGASDDHYYAITFRLAPFAVRDTISMFGEHWSTREIGSYIFALTDITGEFDYVLGVLDGDSILPLWASSMYYK